MTHATKLAPQETEKANCFCPLPVNITHISATKMWEFDSIYKANLQQKPIAQLVQFNSIQLNSTQFNSIQFSADTIYPESAPDPQ